MSQIDQSNHGLQNPIDEIRRLKHEQQLLGQLEAFTRAIHASLHPVSVAYAIANDGRLLLSCDRLSVVLRRYGRYTVEAVSGQDVINRRANAVRLLAKLCQKVLVSEESFNYPTDQTAPQIESVLDAYIDQSQAKSLLLIRLSELKSGSPDTSASSSAPLGAIVVEQFSDAQIDPALCRRAEVIGRHAELALGNALQHHRIFLLPLWSAMGRVSSALVHRSVSRRILLAVCLLMLTAGLTRIPADFALTASGTLEPARKRNVYARADGVVTDLLVQEGTAVTEGQTLVRLRNSDLDVKLEEVVGQLRTTSKKLASIKASRLTQTVGANRDRAQDNALAAEEAELRQWLSSLQEQHRLLTQQKADLTLASPIDGEVITWGVEEKLASRPIRRGQLLFVVSDLSGPWALELLLPDRRMGHLLSAQQELHSDLDVTFILATDTNTEIRGWIKQVATSTRVDEEHGQTVMVTVGFSKDDVSLLRPGAGVTARIHCGRRSVGYVWLHDLFEFIDSRILFRL